jgi:hypothetical protein
VSRNGRQSRVAYADAGAAIRLAIERGVSARLNGQAWRVLAAVIALVPSYSRLADKTYTAQIARFAEIDEKRTRVLLGQLRRRGIIVYVPAQGRNRKSLIGLPPGRPRHAKELTDGEGLAAYVSA